MIPKKVTYRIVKVFSIILAVIVCIGFSENRTSSKLYQDIKISLESSSESYFINREDILNILNNNGQELIVGAHISSVDIKTLENRINDHAYISSAQVYKDLQGNLIVNATQAQPVARILSGEGDRYLDSKGNFMPFSHRYTPRVILISGNYSQLLDDQNIKNTEYGASIFDLLSFIRNDTFWKAQIAQVDIDKNGEIKFYPQVTKQTVEFGLAENVESKFQKLKIFYKEILPQKGWNSYAKVSVKYQNQIICE